MWTFVQRTGALLSPDGSQLTVGYSGNWDGVRPPGGSNDHRNKPAEQSIKSKGPIPVGQYTIGVAFNDPGGKGPLVMALAPDPGNQMFGRDGFLIHGDRAPPRSGTASDGCIILDHDSRQTISGSSDRSLRVVTDSDARFSVMAMALAGAVPAAKKPTKKAPRKTNTKAVRQSPAKARPRPSTATVKGAPKKKPAKAGSVTPKKTSPRRASPREAAKNEGVSTQTVKKSVGRTKKGER